MWWRRIWNARLDWKTTPVVTAAVIAAMLLAFVIPSETAAGVWLILVGFLGLGLMAKMGENETRHRVARLPPGQKLPWWTFRPSLDFPWWATWLLVSFVLGATAITAAAVSGSWAAAAYAIGLALIVYVRRRVGRIRRGSKQHA